MYKRQISSIISSFKRSFADSFIAFAASKVFVGSRQSIVAHPSGDITEYIAFSNINTLLEEANAIAPPEPPSPIIIDKVGRNEPCPCGSGKKYKYCCGAL